MAIVDSPFLKDTTLCAIVRDEMINPAQLPGKSGIRSFVETHAPHVERAVVVDTGSIDGTRQELEQLASEFSNLKVVDHPFVNYVDARNFSIGKVETPFTFVLDCDEVLLSSGFERLGEMVPMTEDRTGIYFTFRDVRSNGWENEGCGHGIRFFRTGSIRYGSSDGEVWEFPYANGRRLDESDRRIAYTEAKIFHFKPHYIAIDKKIGEWYGGGQHKKHDFARSPTTCPAFKEWKSPNPFREKYR